MCSAVHVRERVRVWVREWEGAWVSVSVSVCAHSAGSRTLIPFPFREAGASGSPHLPEKRGAYGQFPTVFGPVLLLMFILCHRRWLLAPLSLQRDSQGDKPPLPRRPAPKPLPSKDGLFFRRRCSAHGQPCPD